MALRNYSGYGNDGPFGTRREQSSDVVYVGTINRRSDDEDDDEGDPNEAGESEDSSLIAVDLMDEEECEKIGKVLCIIVLFVMAVGCGITAVWMAYIFYAWYWGIRLPRLEMG